MQKFDILLQKRSSKSIIYILAGLFMGFLLLMIGGAMIHEFHWYILVLFLLFLLGAGMVFNGLMQYFLYKEVHLIGESDGKTIKFYNTNESGKVFNASDEIDLTEMKRFYIVEKSTKYMMRNYAYEFEGKSTLSALLKEEMDIFPSLYEASPEGRKAVLEFVKTVCPEIELGYENIWQRFNK